MLKFALLPLLIFVTWLIFRNAKRHELSRVVAGALPLTDPAITRITQKMADQLGLYEINTLMLADDGVKSLALPDGRIALSRGLVMQKMRGLMTSEELSSVIAHELGMFTLGYARQRFRDFLAEAGQIPGITRGPFPALGVATSWATSFFLATRRAERRRRSVFEADAWASALLVRIGIGIGPQISALHRLDGLHGSGNEESLPEKLAPIPSVYERVAAIEANEARWRG
jgi:putative metalloprotease